jgi:2Fe-2S ferredoxin
MSRVETANLTCISDAVDAVNTINIVFVLPGGEERTVQAKTGNTLLEIAHKANLKTLLPGNCDGACACATCHVVLPEEWYNKPNLNLNKYSQESEADMLDCAFGLTTTSRLGCQVVITAAMEGLRVRIPDISY